MEIIRTVKQMQQVSKDYRHQKKSIGFVPTMGFLHEGHMRLMEEARKENDIVVVSIFVNPLQFGPNEDFERYPRDEQHDREVAESKGVDILFLPSVEEMYPNEQNISLEVRKRTNVLCGKSRPGHFNGVVTVLAKLFNITRADYVYFGLKDAQQVAVVDALVKDLNFPVEIRPVPTVRESDGLAKSSRNVYLSEQERNLAPNIYKGLKHGQKLLLDGETNPAIIVNVVKDFIGRHTNGKIDYVEILNYPELTPVNEINQHVILATAVYFENARLIDNILMTNKGEILERIE